MPVLVECTFSPWTGGAGATTKKTGGGAEPGAALISRGRFERVGRGGRGRFLGRREREGGSACTVRPRKDLAADMVEVTWRERGRNLWAGGWISSCFRDPVWPALFFKYLHN